MINRALDSASFLFKDVRPIRNQGFAGNVLIDSRYTACPSPMLDIFSGQGISFVQTALKIDQLKQTPVLY